MTTELVISNAIRNAHSIEKVVELINEAPHAEGMEGYEFTAEMLAGQYAFDAAKDSGYEIDESSIEAHLGFLAEAGASFSESEAVEHGVAIMHASKDDE
jgi:hypothetical protein